MSQLQAEAIQASERRGAGTWLLLAVATAGYLLGAGYMLYLSRDQINPDAICYIQSARHYVQGRLDLAICGYWSPLLSWLLIPAVWLGVSPLMTAKVLSLLSGPPFAAGVVALLRKLGWRGSSVVPYVVGLTLVLPKLASPTAPDLTETALVTWYVAWSLSLLEERPAGGSVRAGLMGGAALLAKMFALPFVVVHLGVIAILRFALYRGKLSLWGQARPVMVAMGWTLLVALPWLAAVKLNGEVPLGGSTRIVRSMTPPITEAAFRAMPHRRVQTPKPGRLCVWENPAEAAYPWPTWSPMDGMKGIKRQLRAVSILLPDCIAVLRRADGLGIMYSGSVLAVVFLPLFWRRSGLTGVMVLSAIAAVAIQVGGYSLLYLDERYLWPVHGVMLALAIGGIGALSQAWAEASERRASDSAVVGRMGWVRPQLVLSALLLVSAGLGMARMLSAWAGPAGLGAQATWVRQTASRLPLSGPVVSTDSYIGLYIAYFRNQVFLGEVQEQAPEKIREEIVRNGARMLLVVDDRSLGAKLSESGLFSTAYGPVTGPGGLELSVLQVAGN